jgi:4-hydroxy-tetrahydrodipicolinate synthase
MSELGPILTAVVTPFGEDGRVDAAGFVRLLHHLNENGSDGAVVAGTTGEASTLSDEEHISLIGLAVAEAPEGFQIVAGTGSNDTAHAVMLTSKASQLGVDAVLSVTPYYNRPNRRGIIRHYEEVAKATDVPILLYNIPHRTGTDMPNDLLAELIEIDGIIGVKQANTDNLAMVEGMELFTGNDEDFATTLDLGGKGGILTASHIVGPEMRRMVLEPENRHEIQASLMPVYEALSIAPLASSIKASLDLMGLPGGVPRLPYVQADEAEIAILREMLESRDLIGVQTT